MSVIKALYVQTLIVICLTLFSFSAEAQTPTISVSIDSVAAQKGTTVTIPIRVTQPSPNTFDVGSFSFGIVFDPTVLKPLGPDPVGASAPSPSLDKTGTLSAPCPNPVVQQATSTNRLGVAAVCQFTATDVAANNILIKVVFSVIGNIGATSPLTLTDLIVESDFGDQYNETAVSGTFTVLGPTAASVNLSGRVLTPDGRGLRGAQVILTTEDGNTRMVTTSAFGNYRFTDVQAGQNVTIRVNSKRFEYQPQNVNVNGERADLNFVAQE